MPLACARPAADLQDEALMIRLRGGDVEAFEQIYDRHSAQALRLALRITGSLRLAEEAAQDAFLNLWRSAHSYDTRRGTPKTWLLTMVHNRSIDCLRREARHEGNLELEQAPSRWLRDSELTDEQVVSRDEARRARQAVVQLPAEQRKVIELTYFNGLSHTEIAARVGIPLGTVKGRQRLALTKLNKTFAGQAVLAAA